MHYPLKQLLSYFIIITSFALFLAATGCQLDDEFTHQEVTEIDTVDTIIIVPTDTCNNPIYWGHNNHGLTYYQPLTFNFIGDGTMPVIGGLNKEYLFFSGFEFGFGAGIKRLNLLTGEVVQLTDFGFDLDWCNNGWLVFGYLGNLYRVDENGDNLHLYYSDGVSHLPFWSQNCLEVAFGGGGYGGIINLNGDLIYNLQDFVDHPVGFITDWSNDNRYFLLDKNGDSGIDTIFLYDLEYNELQTPIIVDGNVQTDTRFSPCGNYLLVSKRTSLDLYDLNNENWIELIPNNYELADTAVSKIFEANWYDENHIVYFHFKEDTTANPLGGGFWNGGEYTFRIANIDSLLNNCY